MSKERKICVIGGGAAGLMAAKYALDAGARVTLLEHNEKLGKKLYITGKGRCNLTNACEREELMKNIVRNPRFMYASLALLDNQGIMQLFEGLGVPLKVERGQRVFPQSDHASDISAALEKYLRGRGARIELNTEVSGIRTKEGRFEGVETARGFLPFDACVLATGGMSYPVTGSDGSGHRLLKQLGHSISPCRPALAPVETRETWPRELMGLSLKNVKLSAYCEQKGKRKLLYAEQGEMLFTHFGVSGPLVLTLSSLLPESAAGTQLYIDLKPALDEKQVDARILREFAAMPNRQLISCLETLEPHALGQMLARLAEIPEYKPIHSVTAAERARLVALIKALPLTVKGLRGFEEAIITQGGVNVKEINPSTLESRLVRGLYVAGELLDVDALTGGFNITIAFATGALAGKSAALDAPQGEA